MSQLTSLLSNTSMKQCSRHVAETQYGNVMIVHHLQPPTAHLARLPDSCVKEFAARLSMTLASNPVKVHSAFHGCLSAGKYVIVGH